MTATGSERNGGPVQGRLLRCWLHADLSVASRGSTVIFETARAVSHEHCDTKLREAFRPRVGRGHADPIQGIIVRPTRSNASAGTGSPSRSPQEIPELLPHHEAWLERLVARLSTRGDGWRVVLERSSRCLRELRARGLKVAIVSNWDAGLHRIVSSGSVSRTSSTSSSALSTSASESRIPTSSRSRSVRVRCLPSAVVHVGDTWDEDVVGGLKQPASRRSTSWAARRRPANSDDAPSDHRRPFGDCGVGLNTAPGREAPGPANRRTPPSWTPSERDLGRRGGQRLMSSAAHDEKQAGAGMVRELKAISHDVFNLMTVMYGLQESLQGIPAEDESMDPRGRRLQSGRHEAPADRRPPAQALSRRGGTTCNA